MTRVKSGLGKFHGRKIGFLKKILIIWSIHTILLYLLFSSSLYAQSPKIKFESYSTKQGLIQSSVVTIYQDDEGFMWFGTYGGLNRFDGYNFKTFQNNRNNPKSISDNHIRTICQDTTGILWVGTTDGLNRFFTQTNEFIHFKHDTTDTNSIALNTVYKVFKDKDGDVWVGTWGEGLELLKRIEGDYADERDAKYKFIHYIYFKDSVNIYKNYISDIAEGQDGSIYASAFGLYRINKKTNDIKIYQNDPSNKNSLSSNYVSAVCVDNEGFVWLGTWEGGLNRLDPETDSIIRFYHDPDDKYSLSHDVIMSLYCDDLGIVWVGTWGGGLNRVVPPGVNIDPHSQLPAEERYRFIRYQHSENDLISISGNSIYSIYEDNTGTIWAGTDWSGVNKFNKNRADFGHIVHQEGVNNTLVNNIIHALYFDKKGQLWIGTQEGLNLYNPIEEKFTLFRNEPSNPNSISFDHIRTIVEDQDGNIWIGTLKGLNKYIPQKHKFNRYFVNKNEPGSTNNLSLHASDDGTIWIGNYSGGLFKLDPDEGRFVVYDHSENDPSSISDNQIWAIEEDKNGTLWLGTGKGGLCKFYPSTEKFICFKNDPNDSSSLSSNTVWVLYFDHADELWIGTSSGINKLHQLEDGSVYFEHCFKGTELENIGITGIIEDVDNQFWITSAIGLTCYNPSNNSLANYGVEDGLQDDEFTINALVRDEKTNKIYAGGVNGFNVFNPSEIKGNSIPPVVKIVDLKLFNKSVEVGEEINNRIILSKSVSALSSINLSYKEYIITFEYAALHFKSPEGNQYAFMLEGFEDKWNYIGNQRTATYTNLKPGNYTFRVKASNSDNVWNEEGTSLHIYIKPPYWGTWWFKVIISFALVSILFVFYTLRITRIKNRNLVLKQTVEERTKQLNTKNRLLTKRTEELDKTNEQLSASNEKLSELNRMKNKFFSIIGHDLKNPINTIMGFTELLQKRIDTISKDKRNEFIGYIHNASTQTFILLEDLLEWARSQSENITFEPELNEVGDIVKANIDLLKDQANQKEIEIKLEKESIDTKAFFDERMINTVIRNLLSNAIKYAQPGGLVKISFSIDKPGFLFIHVSDNGVGMEPVQLENLFKLDQTISTKGTTGETGTGLGLILCKEFIERNRGEIWVDSEPAKGSTFSFSLPLEPINQ